GRRRPRGGAGAAAPAGGGRRRGTGGREQGGAASGAQALARSAVGDGPGGLAGDARHRLWRRLLAGAAERRIPLGRRAYRRNRLGPVRGGPVPGPRGRQPPDSSRLCRYGGGTAGGPPPPPAAAPPPPPPPPLP